MGEAYPDNATLPPRGSTIPDAIYLSECLEMPNKLRSIDLGIDLFARGKTRTNQ